MDARSAYLQAHISTQQRVKLVVMLYEGAIRFLRTAKEKLAAGDFPGKGHYIGRAQEIIDELNNALDMEAAPQIASDLRALYNFLHRHLTEANIERSEKKIDEAISILDQLREAWEQIAEHPPVLPEAEEQQDLGAA